MCKLTGFILLILFPLFLWSPSLAANKKHVPAKIQIDSSKIQLKKFDERAITKYSRDKDFDYRTGSSVDVSAWTAFWAWIAYIFGWIWEKIGSIFTSIPGTGTFLKYLFFAASIGFLVYIILKSAGIDIANLWRRDPEKLLVPFSESLEDIHKIDFDTEIDNAISQHNYRLAVRLLYLKSLKQLSDSKLIHWQIDKTNSAYLLELTDTTQKQTFSALTREFEYIWYGNFSINQQAFGSIHHLFQEFKQQIP